MKARQLLLLSALCLSAYAAEAQKIAWESGEDLAFLKGQKVFAVEYDYSNIKVKGEAEAAYLKSQQEELNKDKAGSGDEFADEWVKARTAKYQPHFEKEFDKRVRDSGILVKPGAACTYTLIIATTDMELGKGKTFSKKPAKVTYTLTFVETANKDKVLAKGTVKDVEGEVDAPKGSGFIPGAGGVMSMTANVQNRDYSNRIANAYQELGLALAKYISKKVL